MYRTQFSLVNKTNFRTTMRQLGLRLLARTKYLAWVRFSDFRKSAFAPSSASAWRQIASTFQKSTSSTASISLSLRSLSLMSLKSEQSSSSKDCKKLLISNSSSSRSSSACASLSKRKTNLCSKLTKVTVCLWLTDQSLQVHLSREWQTAKLRWLTA